MEKSSVLPHLPIQLVAPDRQGTPTSLQPTFTLSRQLSSEPHKKRNNKFLLVQKTLEHLVCNQFLLKISNSL